MKIYRECTRKPYNFLTIDTTLPAGDPLRFRKKFFDSYIPKLTVTDQIKILNKKILQLEAQCDLDRQAAKISVLSSNNLSKYKYLIGEDLGLKPSTVEQAKFEYSPLGKVFNKELDKDDQKETLLKKLKNIEDHGKKLLAKNSQSLKAIDYFSQLSAKAKELYLKIKKKK